MKTDPNKAKLLSVLEDAYDGALRVAETMSDPANSLLAGRLAECLAEERARLAEPLGVDYPPDEDFVLEFRSDPNEAELSNLLTALLAVQDKTASRFAVPAIASVIALTQDFLQLLADYRRSQR